MDESDYTYEELNNSILFCRTLVCLSAEGDKLADEVFELIRNELSSGTRGPRPQCSNEQATKLLTFNLYVSYLVHEENWLGIGMRHSDYKVSAPSNHFHLSDRGVRSVVEALEILGLIERVGGDRYSGLRTRIRALKLLREIFQRYELTEYEFYPHAQSKFIVLKSPKPDAVEIDFEMTPELEEIQAVLKDYNQLLRNTFIDIPSRDRSYVERRNGIKVPITHTKKHVYRVFNNGRFDQGGRFYGPWWQQVGRKYRSKIYINNKPTVEIDYSGMHIAILYGKHNLRCPKKPYEVEAPDFVDKWNIKHCYKLLILLAVNSTDFSTTADAFRFGSHPLSDERSYTNSQIKEMIDMFISAHPIIESHLFSGYGNTLMNLDSQVCEQVIKHFTNLGIPVLTVHDSILIQEEYEKELNEVMKSALKSVCTADTELRNDTEKQTETIEYEIVDDDLFQQYLQLEEDPYRAEWAATQTLGDEINHNKKSEGYKRRLRAFVQYINRYNINNPLLEEEEEL